MDKQGKRNQSAKTRRMKPEEKQKHSYFTRNDIIKYATIVVFSLNS